MKYKEQLLKFHADSDVPKLMEQLENSGSWIIGDDLVSNKNNFMLLFSYLYCILKNLAQLDSKLPGY
jgi:hypothetical protein